MGVFRGSVSEWQKIYEEDANKIPFAVFQINLRKELARLEAKWAGTARDHKRPRIAPAHPPGMALQAVNSISNYMANNMMQGAPNTAMYTADDLYNVAMKAFADGKGGAKTCWNCGEPGHIREHCPKPIR